MAAGIIAVTSAILLSWICLFVVTAGVGLVVRRWMAGQSLVNAEALLTSFWLGQVEGTAGRKPVESFEGYLDGNRPRSSSTPRSSKCGCSTTTSAQCGGRKPARRLVPDDSAVAAITLAYSEPGLDVLGWRIHWMVLYVIISMITAFAFATRLGVTL